MGNESSWEKPYRVEVFGEPWLRGILGSSASRPKAVIIICGMVSLFPLVLFTITTLVDGSFRLEGNALGLSEDIAAFMAWSVYSVVFSWAAILFLRFPDVLHTLREVIAKEEERESPADDDKRLSAMKFTCILKRYERSLAGKGNSRYLAAALVALGLFQWGLATATHWFSTESFAYGRDTWASQNYMTSFAARTLYEFFFYIIVAYVLFKLITIMHTMRSICRELTNKGVMRIRPLNPDRAGGLGGFGRYSLSLLLPLAAPAILIVIYMFVLGITTTLMFSVTVYIGLLIFAFFYPLSGAHQAMSNAKETALRTLSRRINRSYDKLAGTLASAEPLTLGDDFEVVDKLDKLYMRAQGMPIWPFDGATFSRFVTIIATVVLSVWLRWLVGLIG